MGNQESIPVNPNGQLKKKKNLSENQARPSNNPRKKNPQKKNLTKHHNTTHFPNSSQYYQENTHYNQQQLPSNHQIINGQQYVQSNNNYGHQRNNIVHIPNQQTYQDFSNYNYELKEKNTQMNNELVNRRLIQVQEPSSKNHDQFMNYPSSSNDQVSAPKPSFDNIKFDPYNFNDDVNHYKQSLQEEKSEFEKHQLREKQNFDEQHSKKSEYLNEKIHMFEEDYNPWEILGMEHDNDYDIQNIKRAYKKRALKYHPDKNLGNKDTSDLFNLITNAYIYLLKKAEEVNEHEIKINRQVSKQDYEDDINENVVNIHLDKDNFNLNKFNQIFEQYKLNDDNDTGYGDLMKGNDNLSEQKKFNSKVSQDVFNAHFNELKKNKHQEQLIKFQEPNALHSSSGLSTELLGSSSSDGFGFSNNNNLSYTDIKSAHFDENLLIDPNSVNYKTYNSVEQLENDRSTISFKANKKEKEMYKKIEFEENERERMRQLRVKEKDGLIKNQFKKMNHKLIVHKKN